MSFFDEDDEPRTRVQRPRAARGGSSADTQTLLVRRAIAGVVLLVFVLLLVFVVRGCRESQRENALKDYNREVSAIAGESSQVGAGFFQVLGQGASDSPQDLQTEVNSQRVQAEQQLKQAEGLDVPDQMRGAQAALLIALEERRDGLDYIGSRIRTALGDSGEQADAAIQQIAGQMQVFLSSDVLYETRVVPFIKAALEAEQIGGQEIARSRFLPDLQWLEPQVVAEQLGQQLSAGAGRNRNEPTGPGLHGTNIDSVAYGDTTLQPDAPNQLTYDPESTFAVLFTNGGENDEFDIKVTLRIEGGSGEPIVLTDTIDQIAPQAQATANLALEDAPPTDTAVTIRVRVAPVPGEEKTDNNEAEYQAIFQGG